MASLLVLHAPIFRAVSSGLIVAEQLPSKIDAVLITRNGDDRHQVAADWVKSGSVGTILLTRPLPNRNVASGIVPSEDALMRSKLIELDISDAVIECLDNSRFRGDWRESRLLGDWLANHPRAQVAVLCDRFDSRSTRYKLNRVLSSDDAQRVHVHGLPSNTYDERNWWRSRSGARSLFSSYLELSYAWLAGEDADEPITWNVDSYEAALRSR